MLRDGARPARSETRAEKLARWALGGMLLLTGISHLTIARRAFRAQVPRGLPIPTDDVVVYSGLAELALGTSLLALRKQRRATGMVAAGFFIAVFPGNIAQYRHGRSAFGLNTDTRWFVRLWMQPVLVVWALWSAGAMEACCRKRLPE